MQRSRMKRKRPTTQPSVNDDPFSGENDVPVPSRKEQDTMFRAGSVESDDSISSGDMDDFGMLLVLNELTTSRPMKESRISKIDSVLDALTTIFLARAEKYRASKCTHEVCSNVSYPCTIVECMNVLNAIEGVEANHYFKACEKFKDPNWRIVFIKMSAMRRRQWLESLT
uniref:Uncharacterized protein n=1 Tax=Davidia involucrata TaxID=16924 RepID=A0A5B7C409_DAVIN